MLSKEQGNGSLIDITSSCWRDVYALEVLITKFIGFQESKDAQVGIVWKAGKVGVAVVQINARIKQG